MATTEKVLRTSTQIKREAGYLYFVDKDCDISRTKMKRYESIIAAAKQKGESQ